MGGSVVAEAGREAAGLHAPLRGERRVSGPARLRTSAKRLFAPSLRASGDEESRIGGSSRSAALAVRRTRSRVIMLGQAETRLVKQHLATHRIVSRMSDIPASALLRQIGCCDYPAGPQRFRDQTPFGRQIAGRWPSMPPMAMPWVAAVAEPSPQGSKAIPSVG